MRLLRSLSWIAPALLLTACGSTKVAQNAPGATTATTADAGGRYGAGYGSPASSTASTAASSAASLQLVATAHGKAVADAAGYALYQYARDTAGTPTCTGGCSANWPPAAAPAGATVGGGLDAAKLSTVAHPGGTTQLVYAHHPLYRFSGDTKPGDTNGQGFSGVWHLVTASGDAAAG